jgi:hypothetical protein
MKTKFIAAVSVGLLLLVGGPVFAHGGSRGGGGGGGGGRSFAAASGGNRGFSGTRGYASGGGGGFNRTFATRGSSFAGRSYRSPSIAFGGGSYGSYNSRGYGNTRSGSRSYGSHQGWDRSREYNSHGHYYRWYNNGWFIVDPYPYGDGSYYGDYANDDGDYNNGSDNTVYAPSGNATGGPVGVQVQRELAQENYYHGPIDGIVGRGTRAAIAAYQRDNGLPVTGTIDGNLINAMGFY